MKLITRVKAYLSNEPHKHCYVLKFNFRDIGTVYCVNEVQSSVEDELLLMMNTFYRSYNYFPECEIIRDIEVPISFDYHTLKNKLKSDSYKFKSLKFLNSRSFYKNPLETFDKLLPKIDYSKYNYQEFLPKWAYHSTEIRDLNNSIISFDKIGYITKSTPLIIELKPVFNPFV